MSLIVLDNKKIKKNYNSDIAFNLSENYEIQVTKLQLKLDQDKRRFKGLNIIQISDLHANQWNIELIEQAVQKINSLNPDILMITGDIICNGRKYLPDLANIFKKINTKYGIYACLGNHDHSDGDGSDRIKHLYKKNNIQLLVNESTHINIKGDDLCITGADDFELGEQNIKKMLKNVNNCAMKIFLTHNPINAKEFTSHNPDLILAGHTHGGQIEGKIFQKLYTFMAKNKYIAGLYNIENSMLYVNKGIGTAMIAPKFFNHKIIINTPRIFSRPEISMFQFIQ